MARKMVLLTGSQTNASTAKTAVNLMRYKPAEVVAVLAPLHAGKTAQAVFGLGGDIPVIGRLSDAPHADTIAIGIAPAGGRIPEDMRAVLLEGIGKKMTILSGLHQFLSNDPEFVRAAEQSGARLFDVRKNNERDVAHRRGINPDCLRVHTVGHDCNVGKMVTSLELSLALQRQGHDCKFVATGQTGIMIEGDGCPVDAVVVDFINGAAEKLVLANQHHAILSIEGQGSISHPRYSAVTLGLLHGCMPQGLILCYEMGRETVYGMDEIKIPPLVKLREWYEAMANIMHPCEVIGIGINGRRFNDQQVREEQKRISGELGLAACDVIKHGAEDLARAVLALKERLITKTT